MLIKVLFIYSNGIDPCTRIQCFELTKGLSFYAETSVLHYTQIRQEDIISNDVVILQRIGANNIEITQPYKGQLLSWIEEYADKTVFVYMIDDLVIEDQNGFPKELITKCNGVICTNEILRQHLLEYNSNIYVLRTYIDMDIINKVKETWLDGFHVVWVSTSGLGIDLMREIVKKVRESFDIKFIYIGHAANQLSGIDGLISLPYLPYEQMISYVKACQVLVNPMQLNEEKARQIEERIHKTAREFIECKSEIKYVLAGASKTAFIASKTAANIYAVKNGFNGILANDTVADWSNAIMMLFQDIEYRKKIIHNAYLDVKRQYSLDAAAKKAEGIMTQLVNINQSSNKRRW